MAEAFLIKVSDTTLTAATQHDADELKHIKLGDPTRVKFTRVRNYRFHKKFFALLNFAFDYWEPDPANQVGEKNFDQFREDIIILAGHYEQWIRLDGATRVVAKSIAFTNMSEDEFEELYAKTIDVIFKYVLTGYTGDERRSVLAELEDFE